ncbi:ComEA family DNA-binding protein [Bizionia sediminis]|uniref:ComEA family DNA-binding protein n=1 Tax=Bizionia sediminis TaxID=1737064 RepID=A0ABW5KU16_9FLAO
MHRLKSHFTFSKKQRNGILLLITVMVLVQVAYVIYMTSTVNKQSITPVSSQLQAEVDSLKQLAVIASQPKIFPFNPNYITDYKGYSLGMSAAEIDRLHAFRASNKWVNSAQEFQKVTQVSDSLLAIMSPYFKFPDWVNKQAKTPKVTRFDEKKPLSYNQKTDLNTATATQLTRVYGIGSKLSERIVAYREKVGGQFAANAELSEIYGLSPEVISNILEQFTVKTPRAIKQYNINLATRDELVTIPYIDYEVAFNIIEERTLRDGFKSLDDLTKVKDFPINKIEIIKLSLTIE